MSYVKYYVYKEQVSNDGGVTWSDTSPLVTTPSGDPLGTYDTLQECSHSTGNKIVFTKSNGETITQHCVSDDGVWYSFPSASWTECPSACTKIEFGHCVTEIGWRYRNQVDRGCGKSYWDNDVSTSGHRIRNYRMCSFEDLGVREIVLPEGLRWIGSAPIGNWDGMFGKNKLTSLILPSTVESIGYLRSFDQSNPCNSCVNPLPSRTFSFNKYLRNVTLNDGLFSIGEEDFLGCTSLERIDIPASLEKLGSDVFSGCTNLKQIVFKGTIPPSLICNNDSQYYSWTCSSKLNLSANSDTYVYVPCGSKSAYTEAINDLPDEKIIEYSGNCGNIPSIDSMYNVLFTYKVGSATTNVYRGSHIITSSNDFTDVIDGYADEIIIPSDTMIRGYVTASDCKDITINGAISGITSHPTTFTCNAENFIINSSDINVAIYGGNDTKTVTINTGCTPLMAGSFTNASGLVEVFIDGNPVLGYDSFNGCGNIQDVYISYSGSMISYNSWSDYYHAPFYPANPTIHVPCNLYWTYKGDSFWGKFDNIVVDDASCTEPQRQPVIDLLSNNGFDIVEVDNYNYTGRTRTDGAAVTYKLQNARFKVEVWNHKDGGLVRYCTVYIDGELVYDEHGNNKSNYDYELAVDLQNDGLEHILTINSVYNGQGTRDNGFKVYVYQ